MRATKLCLYLSHRGLQQGDLAWKNCQCNLTFFLCIFIVEVQLCVCLFVCMCVWQGCTILDEMRIWICVTLFFRHPFEKYCLCKLPETWWIRQVWWYTTCCILRLHISLLPLCCNTIWTYIQVLLSPTQQHMTLLQYKHNRAGVKYRFVSVSASSTFAQFKRWDTVLSFVEQHGEKLEVLCLMQLRFPIMQAWQSR